MLDVIVVGGGPVGSYTACELARMGHSVLVVERREKLGGMVCCTGIISLECARRFVLDERLILRQVNSVRLFSPSGRSIHFHRKEPLACVIDRAGLDVHMAERAEKEGAEYLLGADVSSIEVADDKTRVRVNHMGLASNLEARAAVLATGSGPCLIKQYAPSMDDYVMGAQAVVESPAIDEIEVYLGRKTAPGFFAWLVPARPGKAIAGLLARHNAGGYLRRLLASLAERGKIASAKVEISYRGITLKSKASTYGERFLVAGGSAAQVKPTTGGGIYYGLLAAEVAADTLHKSLLDDDLSSENLAHYEQKWRSRLWKEITAGIYIREFYEHLDDHQIDNISKLAEVLGLEESLRDEDLSFDWHGRMLIKMLGNSTVSRAISTAITTLDTEIF